MAINAEHADDEQLHSLLWAEEESDAFLVAAAHVATCETCRMRLDELSGSRKVDDETRDLLRDYPWASGSLVDKLLADQSPVDGKQSLRTDSIDDCDLDCLGPASHPELLGRLGRYEIERVIGKGGMGIVLKAHDTELNRPVAVKVLAKHLAYSGAARQRFARESRAAAAVVHEHVVAIHNVDTDGEVPFLVMQFVSGESLQSRVDREGPLDAKQILRVGIQVAAGLEAAHEQGVIHRDIKPANILLENGVERVLITDFGLARTVDDASLTQTGVIAGTPHYMSPEQSNGQASDHRTDLFSLGSVLYFMATGHPPFRAERMMGVLNRICHDQQKPLWQVNSDLPDDFSILVDRLLEKQPSKRLSTAAGTREQLVKLLAQIQQPRTGLMRHVRRISMRYPKGLHAGVLLLMVLIVVSLVAFLAPETAIDVRAKERPATSQKMSDFVSPAISPVFDAEDAKAFEKTLDDLDSRLDALNQFNGDQLSLYTNPDESDTLQTLHQRLERLHENTTLESQVQRKRD